MTLTMPVALCLTAMARTSALSGSVLTIDSTGSRFKVKIMAQLSGGDTDTVIRAAAMLLDVEQSDVLLEDVFPAKIALYVDMALLSPDREELIEPIAYAIKRILVAGVGIRRPGQDRLGLWSDELPHLPLRPDLAALRVRGHGRVCRAGGPRQRKHRSAGRQLWRVFGG